MYSHLYIQVVHSDLFPNYKGEDGAEIHIELVQMYGENCIMF